jgi:hypothetical protein
VIVLAVVGYLAYKHFSDKNKLAASGVSTVQQYEKGTSQATDGWLKSKNYQDYMNQQLVLVVQYEGQNDYKNAERIMSEIFANVPQDKINSSVYDVMVGLQQAEGNNDKYKHYLDLLIKQLKAEGRTDEAAGKQTLLDSAK